MAPVRPGTRRRRARRRHARLDVVRRASRIERVGPRSHRPPDLRAVRAPRVHRSRCRTEILRRRRRGLCTESRRERTFARGPTQHRPDALRTRGRSAGSTAAARRSRPRRRQPTRTFGSRTDTELIDHDSVARWPNGCWPTPSWCAASSPAAVVSRRASKRAGWSCSASRPDIRTATHDRQLPTHAAARRFGYGGTTRRSPRGLDAMPDASLVVRAGEGLEPADAAAHPRCPAGIRGGVRSSRWCRHRVGTVVVRSRAS